MVFTQARRPAPPWRSPAARYGALVRFRPFPRLPDSVSAGPWTFAGFNYPIRELVAGAEIDAGGFSPYGALAPMTSLRARLGVLVLGKTLLYATGGVAAGHFAASLERPGRSRPPSPSAAASR